jgi:hypothetical protein
MRFVLVALLRSSRPGASRAHGDAAAPAGAREVDFDLFLIERFR